MLGDQAVRPSDAGTDSRPDKSRAGPGVADQNGVAWQLADFVNG